MAPESDGAAEKGEVSEWHSLERPERWGNSGGLWGFKTKVLQSEGVLSEQG